ncbi:MAG: non-hydrolyzing UDP-N-acetylglucosamine 2-epimerase [Phycisphaerae bacterium]
MKPLKIICLCAARPNFMKIAPIITALNRCARTEATLVHTGQHYDANMNGVFFEELGIPQPDVHLGVGSGSHASQTAEVLKRFEPVCLERTPQWVIAVGDVNSTLAGALVASKLGIRIAHVEAGLRSFDRTMPEEINRVLTDAISDLLFVTERSAIDNLSNEGVAASRVHFVGNVMIDTLMRMRDRASGSDILKRLGLEPAEYALATLHRPANVDHAATFGSILAGLNGIAQDLPVIFPIHPRTRRNLDRMGLTDRLEAARNIVLLDPLGYVDFLQLMANSAVVLTDSGGIQEETTILGVSCLTVRENTERPVTLSQGTNQLVGCSGDAMIAAYRALKAAPAARPTAPELWDGHAAERIVDLIVAAD